MLYTLESSSPNLQKQIQDIHADVLGKRNAVILLFAHWCGHCQMFMGGPDSTWAKVVKQYRTNPHVDLIQLEDTVYSQMRSSAPAVSRQLTLPIQLSKMGIQGFPTLAFIYPRTTSTGSVAPFRIYDDNRSLESCKLFIDQGILSASHKPKPKPKSASKPTASKPSSPKPKPKPKPKSASKPKMTKKPKNI